MPKEILLEIAFSESPETVRLGWREELRHLDGVDDARFALAHPAPVPGRSVGTLDFGKLLLTIVPEAAKTVFGVIAGLAKRPGAPAATVKVKVGDNAVELEFAARDLTPEVLAGLAERLAAAMRGAT